MRLYTTPPLRSAAPTDYSLTGIFFLYFITILQRLRSAAPTDYSLTSMYKLLIDEYVGRKLHVLIKFEITKFLMSVLFFWKLAPGFESKFASRLPKYVYKIRK